jgi:hypothetical protein
MGLMESLPGFRLPPVLVRMQVLSFQLPVITYTDLGGLIRPDDRWQDLLWV